MKVAVTGASGFLGTHLVAGLLAAGDRVRALAPIGEAAPPMPAGDAEVVRGDVRDPASLQGLLDGWELV